MTTSLRRIRHAALLVGMLATAASAPLHAQVSPDSIKLRNDCRLADQVLRTGHPAPHREDALHTIPLCPGSTASLGEAWRAGTLDSTFLPLLVTATRDVASPALRDDLFAVLQSATRPSIDRVGALLVLLHWAEPATLPRYVDLVGDPAMMLRSYYGTVDHWGEPSGLASLGEPVLDRLYPIVVQLGREEPDAMVRTATQVATNNLAGACRARGWSCTSFAP